MQPTLQDTIIFPRGSQAHISNSAQASHVAINLAASLHDAAAAADTCFWERSTDQRFWLLECLERVATCLVAILRVSNNPAQIRKSLTFTCSLISAILCLPGKRLSAQPSVITPTGMLRIILHFDVLSNDISLQQAVAQLLLTDLSYVLQNGGPNHNTLGALTTAVVLQLQQDDERYLALDSDLRSALNIISRCSTTREPPETGAAPQETVQLESVNFENEALRAHFRALDIQVDVDDYETSDRPTKRRRTDIRTEKVLTRVDYGASIGDMTTNLGLESRRSLAGVEQDIIDKLKLASQTEQEKTITALAELPCQSTSDVLSNPESKEGHSSCATCHRPQTNRSTHMSSIEMDSYEEVLTKLIDWQGLQRLKRGRLLLMSAIQRFVNHAGDSDKLDISRSPLGQWCLRSLHSSQRELRITAGRCMASFVRRDIPTSIRVSNSAYCLKFLKALGERSNLGEEETLVLACAQVARVCGDEELKTTLLELVEYLGASHSLISSVAYEEIERCAEHRGLSVDELFRPYWNTVAIAVVKDFHTKPQKLQNLCDLLAISNVNRFLLQTQAETIPYLIMTRDKALLQRIASARKAEIKDICLQPQKHLALILASLLLHYPSEPEKTIMNLLCEAAQEFSNTDLSALVRLEPITTACEMFKAAGEVPSTKKAPVHQAIKTFVALAERKPGQSKPAGRSTKVLAQFLDNHIFGILTRFSDIIDAPAEAYAIPEKRRCIRAITEMVSMAHAHFNFAVAIPQIKACLQSALNEQDLCDDAFGLWAIFISSLATEELDDLLEYTFTVIVCKWDKFTGEAQQRAHTLIAHLIKQHNPLVREKILYLPSLESIPLFAKFETEINKFRVVEPLIKRLEAFCARCTSQNALICEQGASELLIYLEQNQRPLQELASATEPHPVVINLVHALIDAAYRFSIDQPAIGKLSTQCLGVIGCIEAQKPKTLKPHEEVVVLSNFDRVSETVDFIAYLLEHVLIKAFHSAANGRVQNYLAWAMQELLKHCDFKAALSRSKSSQSGPQSQRWMAMTDAARNTLLPFFDTKYVLNRSIDGMGDVQRRTALFKSTKSHAEWLRELVYDLLQRGGGENTMIFFPVLSRIIRGHDLSIPTFLLPYVATNIMIAGTDQEKAMMQHELLIILETDIQNLGPGEVDNVKKASKVFDLLQICLSLPANSWYSRTFFKYLITCPGGCSVNGSN